MSRHERCLGVVCPVVGFSSLFLLNLAFRLVIESCTWNVWVICWKARVFYDKVYLSKLK